MLGQALEALKMTEIVIFYVQICQKIPTFPYFRLIFVQNRNIFVAGIWNVEKKQPFLCNMK